MTAHHPPCQLNRTWHFNFCGHKLYFCTRCIGQYSGMILALFAMLFAGFKVTTIWNAGAYFLLLPFPATCDWFTQTMGWRESINSIRVLSGFLYGISLGVCI